MTEDYKRLQSYLSDEIFIFCLENITNVTQVKKTSENI